MTHSDDANHLRKHFVKGDHEQAPTVQGELVRALDVLRHDAAEGKARGDDHAILVTFLRDILVGSNLLQPADAAEIEEDLAVVASGGDPAADHAPYDRLTDRVVQWSDLQPDALPHHPNPALQR